ncbi:hypothetical protein H1R20_g12962, partial [Candolleomyces eurysporus]
MLSFWTLYLGPVYLEKAFSNRAFYEHFIKLVQLVNLCLQFELNHTDVETIRQGFAAWVQEYERLYYQYSEDRLSACPLTIHALLHIADGIEFMGPVWVYWAFAMERFCGKLARAIKSRRFPFANLDNQVLAQAQFTCIKNIYGLEDEISLNVPKKSWETEIPNPQYTNYRLLPPYQSCNLDLIPAMKSRIAAALVTRFTDADGNAKINVSTATQILELSTIDMWGRLKRLGEGDTMLASEVVRQKSEDRRDATYVRYEQLVDRYANSRKRTPEFYLKTFYGQLKYIFVIKIPALEVDVLPELEEPTTIAFGAIQSCNVTRHHPDLDIHYYRKMGPMDIVDIAYIQCLVGRVHWNNEWIIFDRSGPLARSVPEFTR